MYHSFIQNKYDLSFSKLKYSEAVKNNISVNNSYLIFSKFIDT